MAFSSSSLPYRTPMPIGAIILWPEKAIKSAPSFCHVHRHVRNALRAVQNDDGADGMRFLRRSFPPDKPSRAHWKRAQARRFSSFVVIFASILRVGQTAVLRPGTDKRASRPSPVATICHGTRLLWCSLTGRTISSPSLQKRQAVAVSDKVQRFARIAGKNHLAVLFRADEFLHRVAGVFIPLRRLDAQGVKAAVRVCVLPCGKTRPPRGEPAAASASSRHCRDKQAVCRSSSDSESENP